MVRARYKIDASPLFRAMKRAIRNEVSEPFFRIGTFQFTWWEALRMREGGRTRKVPMIHVTYQGKYIGRIEADRYLAGSGFDTKEARREVAEQIKLIVTHPRKAAAAEATVTLKASGSPRCACCGRPLAGVEDRRSGVGMMCSRKWGWARG